jgi:ATP-dependent Lon protease
MLKYIKKAFTNHWNLLAFAGGLAAAAISGHPDVFVPVVLAAEAAYLGFAGTHPKFQKYVDIQEAQAEKKVSSVQNAQALERIKRSLPESAMQRFNELRYRCQKLRQIAADLKPTGFDNVGSSLDSMQIEGLDRLLWVFLRLLFTQHTLQGFIDNTSLERMQRDQRNLQDRLAKLDTDDHSERAQKIRHAIEDNLRTVEERIENYKQAEANFEIVELELDRLENKIKSLAEMSVNRQEPDFISNQVDTVASSMKHAEQTMNDLRFATGLESVDEDVPELMQEIYEIR